MAAILLKAIQQGELDTELIEEFRGIEPARILTKKEIKELFEELEKL
ncbi:MAG: hypothetical protein LCH67_06205 [Bacteroidetes bacterium]|nr:hypothetical protein [Bacteroidota bacterium]